MNNRSMIMRFEDLRAMVNGDLKMFILNINLSTFIIYKNSPSMIITRSNLRFYIFIKPFWIIIVFNVKYTHFINKETTHMIFNYLLGKSTFSKQLFIK